METLDQSQPNLGIRPEPNGINETLILFSMTAMFAVPLLIILLLTRMQVVATVGTLGNTGITIGTGLFGIFSFITGYFVFAGSMSGRSLMLWLVLAAMLVSEVLSYQLSSGVGKFSYLIFIGVMVWIYRSEVCRNNYNSAYRNQPIRKKPLPKNTRTLLLAWGGVVTVGIGYVLFTLLTAPTMLERHGFRRMASRESVEIQVRDARIIIPPPARATHISNTVVKQEGMVVNARFALMRNDGMVTTWTISHDEIVGDTALTEEEFGEMKQAVVSSLEAQGADMRIIDSPDNLVIVTDETATLSAQTSVRIKTATTMLYVAHESLTLTVQQIAPNRTALPDIQTIRQNWTDAIRQAN